MQIHTLASGSTGNSTLICDKGTAILIDMGISCKRLVGALTQLGMSVNQLSGVLITHEHTDHICGLTTFIKHHEIPIFAPRTVANHLRYAIAGVDDYISEVPIGSESTAGGLCFVPFRTPHDTPESVGYRVTGSRTLGYCTDFGHVSAEVTEGLYGVDAVVLEANHDLQMLKDGPYPPMLKRRILSDHGHLSNLSCANLAMELYDQGARQFVLAHLSRENNTPLIAQKTVCDYLNKHGINTEIDVSINVAPEKDILSLPIEVYSKC